MTWLAFSTDFDQNNWIFRGDFVIWSASCGRNTRLRRDDDWLFCQILFLRCSSHAAGEISSWFLGKPSHRGWLGIFRLQSLSEGLRNYTYGVTLPFHYWSPTLSLSPFLFSTASCVFGLAFSNPSRVAWNVSLRINVRMVFEVLCIIKGFMNCFIYEGLMFLCWQLTDPYMYFHMCAYGSIAPSFCFIVEAEL